MIKRLAIGWLKRCLRPAPLDESERFEIERVIEALRASGGEPVAWRYRCHDGSEVLMPKRLTDEQKRRGYYTGGDGDDEVGNEAIIGPFHWAEETPLCCCRCALRERQPPTEPTEEMVRAAYKDQPDAINAGFAQAYRVMVAASPPTRECG